MPPKLIVQKDREAIKEYAIERVQIELGSAVTNDIVIEDASVSPHHTSIENIDGTFYLLDLMSKSGTFLNDRKISKKEKLKNGDEIRIGNCKLMFVHKKPPDAGVGMDADTKTIFAEEQREASDDETIFIQEEIADEETRLIDHDKTMAMMPSAPNYLLAIYGPYFGNKYKLNFGDTRIGRDEKLNDIVINKDRRGKEDKSISRRHATISAKGGQFFLRDKRSKTRTFLNQKKTERDGRSFIKRK